MRIIVCNLIAINYSIFITSIIQTSNAAIDAEIGNIDSVFQIRLQYEVTGKLF